MTFNWFRREYDEEEGNAKETTPQGSAEKVADDNPTPVASTAASTQSQELLNWAKAAYSNIQKQQVHQAPLPTAAQAESTPLAAPDTSTVEIPGSDAVGAESEPTVAAIPEPVSQIAATTTEPQAVDTDRTTPPESSTPEEIPAVEPPPEPTEALPFWAQSEADRQARIAALAANAIAEPTPATPSKPVESIAPPTPSPIKTLPTEVEPAIAFDEGFLWSAEILAAQGRKPEDISIEEITWLKQLRQGLNKTRLNLVNQLKSLVGQGPLNAEAVDEIEALLLQADVGVAATDRIVEALQTKLKAEVLPPEAGIAFLKQILCQILDAPLASRGKQKFSPVFAPKKNQLNIWLMTGVNGAGKTTTIGKIAHIARKSGYSTLIAAADTFRAAAVQQVQVWGDRAQVEVIANVGQNTDPAAVVFDAIMAAQARGTELLLVDTAGRLQNKKNLMEELSKIRRIVDKKASDANVESLLVLDATLGQNGLRQAEVFAGSAGISGVVLTKLDGTAKGGVALAVVQQLNLPIRFIGAGEGIEDLRPFSSYEFVEALLSS
ncbi:signal recognition particle-docking protein FtsY [Pseudanabaena sp. PCC 6802]|uniref:signal recognition particle-docking protein FtsY n=1 Tax=Pseudanabaena sp. PCC 6802 TaxID=118173 RepID=UPI000349454E|nr:signal recognition particle-docking protein FtsY [Pseudanabaena sp. PCC 6802]